jgi:hypothetical protein
MLRAKRGDGCLQKVDLDYEFENQPSEAQGKQDAGTPKRKASQKARQSILTIKII